MLKIILLKNVAYVDKAGYWAVDELSWAWCFLLSQHIIQIFKLFSASTLFLFLVSTWGAEGRQSPMAGGGILPDRTSTGQKYSEKVAKILIVDFFLRFSFLSLNNVIKYPHEQNFIFIKARYQFVKIAWNCIQK